MTARSAENDARQESEPKKQASGPRWVPLLVAGVLAVTLFAGARRRRRLGPTPSPPNRPPSRRDTVARSAGSLPTETAARGAPPTDRALAGVDLQRLARAALSHPKVPRAAALLGIALTASSLHEGFFLDDHILRQRLLDSPPHPDGRSEWQRLARLFVFVDADSPDSLEQRGDLPWWAAQDLQISFYRPLAALTHWVDFRLWPRSPAAMHGHSVLWYAAACSLATDVFRHGSPRHVAGLAGILFALDQRHCMTVAWLANRNAIVALVFTLLATCSFGRGRRGWRPGAPWSLACLVLSLLSAEIGVATLAFFFSYVLFLDSGSWRRRALALAPATALALLGQIGYRAAGYGVRASDQYIDPGQDPLRFLLQLPERLLILLHGQFGWRDIALYNYSSTAGRAALRRRALAVVAGLLAMSWPALRRRRSARFYAMAMVLCLLPVSAMQLAGSRLLLFAGVGAAGLLAETIDFHARRGPTRMLAAIGLLHLARAPAWFLSCGKSLLQRWQDHWNRCIDIGDDARLEDQDVMLVNVPNTLAFLYFSAVRTMRGQPTPRRLRLLAPGAWSVDLERVGERTLRLRPRLGFLAPPGSHPDGQGPTPERHAAYLYQHYDATFRSRTRPFRLGQEIERPGMTVTIVKLTSDGRPLEIEVHCTRPLDDDGYRWLAWDWQESRYRLLDLPPVGGSTQIPGMETLEPGDVGLVF